MKEWDIESAQRKFLETLTLFSTPKGKQLFWVTQVGAAANDKDITYHGLENPLSPQKEIDGEPLYHRFDSRFYMTDKGGWAAVKRVVKKSFKIGLCSDNYFWKIYGQKGQIHPIELRPFTPLGVNVEQALAKEGPISDYLYIDKSNVYYLDQSIGFRKGTKFMVSDSLCQEVKDALRGYKCSINP